MKKRLIFISILLIIFNFLSVINAQEIESQIAQYINQECIDKLGMIFDKDWFNEDGEWVSSSFIVVAGMPIVDEVKTCVTSEYIKVSIITFGGGTYEVSLTFDPAQILHPMLQIDYIPDNNLEFEIDYEVFDAISSIKKDVQLKNTLYEHTEDYLRISWSDDYETCSAFYATAEYDREIDEVLVIIPTDITLGDSGTFYFSFTDELGIPYHYEQEVTVVQNELESDGSLGFNLTHEFDLPGTSYPYAAISSHSFSGNKKPIVTYCSESPFGFEVQTISEMEDWNQYFDFNVVLKKEE